jgi:hypothetical protein
MKTSLRFFVRLIGCALFVYGGGAVVAASSDATKSPLFAGTGAHTRAITGAKAETQRYFDQGVAFITGFNHDEGLRAMEYAVQLDPECAMAWWGVALACSPHINNTGVSAERAKRAREALAEAEKFSAACTSAEKALIRAMGVRFAQDPKAKRKPLDEAYADAMREVWQAHPNDADIAAWTADARMMLRPWDLWHRDGKPQPGTEEVVAALDAAQALRGLLTFFKRGNKR